MKDSKTYKKEFNTMLAAYNISQEYDYVPCKDYFIESGIEAESGVSFDEVSDFEGCRPNDIVNSLFNFTREILDEK